MEISNDDLARILGRMEAKLDAQASSIQRLEGGLASLDTKVSTRLDEHERRLHELEIANPKKLAEALKDHELRLQGLERGAAKAGVVSGIGSSLALAALIEWIKHSFKS